jgi:hypothetical protein
MTAATPPRAARWCLMLPGGGLEWVRRRGFSSPSPSAVGGAAAVLPCLPSSSVSAAAELPPSGGSCYNGGRSSCSGSSAPPPASSLPTLWHRMREIQQRRDPVAPLLPDTGGAAPQALLSPATATRWPRWSSPSIPSSGAKTVVRLRERGAEVGSAPHQR